MINFENLNDYYNEENRSIFALRATFDNYLSIKFKDMNSKDLRKSKKLFAKDAKELPIPPKSILIYKDRCVLSWYFWEDIIITNQEDMKMLLLNFENFVNQISFSKGVIDGVGFPDGSDDECNHNILQKVLGIRHSVEPVRIKMDEITTLHEDVNITYVKD